MRKNRCCGTLNPLNSQSSNPNSIISVVGSIGATGPTGATGRTGADASLKMRHAYLVTYAPNPTDEGIRVESKERCLSQELKWIQTTI